MFRLTSNWFTEGLIDLEYKQYILQAYLEDVKRYFAENKLYPVFSDLISHVQTLRQFQAQKQALARQFPQTLEGFDLTNATALYRPTVEDDTTMQEIDAIVAYALPLLCKQAEDGKRIYTFAEQHVKFQTVGVVPMYCNEGFLLVRNGMDTQVLAYRFGVSFFTTNNERMTGIYLEPVESFNWSRAWDYLQMKTALKQHCQQLPNPVTYAVESDYPFPTEETLLPIAKRLLLTAVIGK